VLQDAVREVKDAAWDATVGRAEHAVSTVGETARGATSIVIDTIKQNPIPAALAGLSLYWLYRNRSGGQSSYGSGYSAGSSRTTSAYLSTRTPQAYPIRTGYASESERQRMMEHGGLPEGTSPPARGQISSSESGADGGVMESAGRIVSSAGGLVSDAASSAGHLASDAGETAMDAGSSLMDLVQRNPIPAALVGIGLGWLYMSRTSGSPPHGAHNGSHYRYSPDTVRQASGSEHRGATGSDDESMIGRATSNVGDMASSAQEHVGEMAEAVQERVGDMADSVKHRTQRAPGQLQRMIEERPLTAAAVAASLGAAVGFWLPTTQVEQQLMGPAHDQAMERVQAVASETIDKVEDVAREVRSTVREEARSKGLTV
jgi:ElaB/YqjD/DUF883 family membrane-anchored ribosome-binding protein